MSYPLSFGPEFFDDSTDSPFVSEHPTSVRQALVSMENEDWKEMIKELELPDDIDSVINFIMETNTCTNLDFPVEVWIDPDGCWTLLIY